MASNVFRIRKQKLGKFLGPTAEKEPFFIHHFHFRLFPFRWKLLSAFFCLAQPIYLAPQFVNNFEKTNFFIQTRTLLLAYKLISAWFGAEPFLFSLAMSRKNVPFSPRKCHFPPFLNRSVWSVMGVLAA